VDACRDVDDLRLHGRPKVDAFLERHVLNFAPLHHYAEIARIDLGAPGDPEHQKASEETSQAILLIFHLHTPRL
jgi:hypothetical protein